MGTERTKVFISYAHADAHWLERLKVHLKQLEREGLIDRWDDTRIASGQDWRKEIGNALDEAAVALLLVSADFLASDFIANDELPVLLEAAQADGIGIIPVILSPCRFHQTSRISRYQSVNKPEDPLIDMTEGEREATWVKVTDDILMDLKRQSLEGRRADARSALQAELRAEFATQRKELEGRLRDINEHVETDPDWYRCMWEKQYFSRLQEHLENKKAEVGEQMRDRMLANMRTTARTSARSRELGRELVKLVTREFAIAEELEEVSQRIRELSDRMKR